MFNLLLPITHRSGKIPSSYRVPIPMTINKYFQFKYVNAEEFKFKWRPRKSLAFKSETLRLNRRVAKSAYDFKLYFPSVVDLNPDREYDYISGINDLKLGGLFQIGKPCRRKT